MQNNLKSKIVNHYSIFKTIEEQRLTNEDLRNNKKKHYITQNEITWQA